MHTRSINFGLIALALLAALIEHIRARWAYNEGYSQGARDQSRIARRQAKEQAAQAKPTGYTPRVAPTSVRGHWN